MSKSVTLVPHVAHAKGFYGNGLIEAGQEFHAPADFKASWATKVGEKPAKPKASDRPKGNPLLAKPILEIIPELAALGQKELEALQAEEQAGENRKGLQAAIGDEIANKIANPPAPKRTRPTVDVTEAQQQDDPLA